MDVATTNLDIILGSESKIDDSYPVTQFSHEGYCKPYRKDRTIWGGGLLMLVNENIPSNLINKHNLPEDIEIICVEINLRKQKWLIIGIYNPPKMKNTYFC